MKNLLKWMISFALLVSMPAVADPTNANPTVPLAAGSCNGSNCKGTPNGPTNPFYVSGTSGSDATKLALDTTMQSILAALDAPLTFNLPTNASTATNQVTANGYLLTLSNFTTSASTSALQTSGNTTLSSILTKLNASIAVTGTFWQATQPISAASLPLPSNAAQETGGNLAALTTNTGLHTGTMTQTSVSCGTGSTTLLAAAAASQYIGIKVPASAANVVWINYAGSPAVATTPSEDIGVGQKVTWTSGPNGFLPTAQINCIASSATTVTLEYK